MRAAYFFLCLKRPLDHACFFLFFLTVSTRIARLGHRLVDVHHQQVRRALVDTANLQAPPTTLDNSARADHR